MVCYREHELSMTNKLWKEDVVASCDFAMYQEIVFPLQASRRSIMKCQGRR
jgi:hypothetical protein